MSSFKKGDRVVVAQQSSLRAIEVGDTGTVMSIAKFICFVRMDYPREGLTHHRPFANNKIELYSPFKKSAIFDVIEVSNG